MNYLFLDLGQTMYAPAASAAAKAKLPAPIAASAATNKTPDAIIRPPVSTFFLKPVSRSDIFFK